MICLSIRLFSQGGCSYRSCWRVLQIISPHLKLKVPHFTTIRQWVLRLGYHKLKICPSPSSDWVLILDFSISVGAKKCLVILGIQLSKLRAKDNFCLTYQDVHPLYIGLPKNNEYGEFVYQKLTQVHQKIGSVVQIVADKGVDIQKGIRLFQEREQNAPFSYDCTHLMASILKKNLKTNDRWLELLKKTDQCKHQTKQSPLAFLSPTHLRSKSRYMDLGPLLRWIEKISAYEQRQEFSGIEVMLKKRELKKSLEQQLKIRQERVRFTFEEKFGWIREFKDEIKAIGNLVGFINQVNKKLKYEGLSQESIHWVEQLVNITQPIELVNDFGNKVIEGLKESLPNKIGSYLASSDIIESLFGKYKQYRAQSAMTGFTISVLTIALFTAEINEETVQEAMLNTKEKELESWRQEAVGESIAAKRKRYLTKVQKPQEKQSKEVA